MKPLLWGSDAKEVIRNGLEFSASQEPSAQLDMTSIQFLKARYAPIYQVHSVSVLDVTGQCWRFTFLLMQKEGLWCIRTSGGGLEAGFDEPMELRDSPWVRLETLSMPNEFYAFGEVLDRDYAIVRVRLLDSEGLVLEDSVEDGMVLFWSERQPTLPIQLELYNDSGSIVSRQTITVGTPPSATKEM